MQPYQPPSITHNDTPFDPTLDEDVAQQITGIMSPFPTTTPRPSRKYLLPIIVVILVLILAAALYFIWVHPSSTSSAPSQNTGTTNNTSSQPSDNNDNSASNSPIQVYVIGQVKHPGIYNVPSDARIYQALQAAGGPLPDANLVALNLATRVSDGQEIYVPRVGEPLISSATATSSTATASNSSPVNINTASATELRQQLHISSKTAQAIITYRTQHGPYTSVSQLANAVSKTIYNRIKNMVTISS
jgi:competence protein ComEA